jgi:histidinol dehydrogenase
MVLAGGDAPTDRVCGDLLAQLEHGTGSIVALVTDDSVLAEEITGRLSVADDGGTAAVVQVDSPTGALAVAEAFAPEHLMLVGETMEPLVSSVRRAGATFVGSSTGVAFGDYIAGSNHTLPTAGAARFASAMSARTFRRLTSVVELDDAAAARLAAAAIPIAEAEGFSQHAASMRLRQNQ